MDPRSATACGLSIHAAVGRAGQATTSGRVVAAVSGGLAGGAAAAVGLRTPPVLAALRRPWREPPLTVALDGVVADVLDAIPHGPRRDVPAGRGRAPGRRGDSTAYGPAGGEHRRPARTRCSPPAGRRRCGRREQRRSGPARRRRRGPTRRSCPARTGQRRRRRARPDRTVGGPAPARQRLVVRSPCRGGRCGPAPDTGIRGHRRRRRTADLDRGGTGPGDGHRSSGSAPAALRRDRSWVGRAAPAVAGRARRTR